MEYNHKQKLSEKSHSLDRVRRVVDMPGEEGSWPVDMQAAANDGSQYESASRADHRAAAHETGEWETHESALGDDQIRRCGAQTRMALGCLSGTGPAAMAAELAALRSYALQADQGNHRQLAEAFHWA